MHNITFSNGLVTNGKIIYVATKRPVLHVPVVRGPAFPYGILCRVSQFKLCQSFRENE